MDFRKSIKKNYIYNLAYQILLLLAPLITTPIVSRSLTADGVGTYGYIYSIVSYFVMVSILGSSTFGQREISYVQNDTHKRSVVFFETLLFRIITCAICGIAYVIFALVQSDNRIIYLIMTFFIFGVATDISWFFQGLEEFGKIIRRSIIVKIINILLIVVFIREKSDLFFYAFFLAVIPCVGNITLWFYLPKYIHKVRIPDIKLGYVFTQSFSLFLPTVAIQVYTVLDKTMIGLITQQVAEIGYYDQAEKISKMSVAIITSLSTVMIPRIGSYYSSGERTLLYTAMYKSYRFSILICAPLCVGVATAASNFVPWFFGPGYDKVVPLMIILSLLIPALGISNITGMQYLIPTKRQKQYTISVTAGAMLNLVCNRFMIYYWNSTGAAIASVFAELFVAGLQLYYVRNEISFFRIIKSGIKYIIGALIMGVVLIMESQCLSPRIYNTAIMIITGMAMYTVVLMLLRDSYFVESVNILKNKMLKRSSD